MKRLDLSVKKLIKIVATNEIVGKGSFGIVYKLDNDTLFKFNFRLFLNYFEYKDGKINFRKLSDISEIIKCLKEDDSPFQRYNNETIEKLIGLQDKIHLTKLTQGMVYIDGFCVGYLLHYHKDMTSLFDYLKGKNGNSEERLKIFQNLKNAVQELYDNNIFLEDLSSHNILINPKTCEIQLIDFEDLLTSVREDRPAQVLENVRTRFGHIKENLVPKCHKEELTRWFVTWHKSQYVI